MQFHSQPLPCLGLEQICESYPCSGSAVVVNEERPTIGRYSHFPSRGQEALICFMLGFRWAVGRRLRGLRVGKCVLYGSPYRGIIGSLQQETGIISVSLIKIFTLRKGDVKKCKRDACCYLILLKFLLANNSDDFTSICLHVFLSFMQMFSFDTLIKIPMALCDPDHL